MALLGIVPRAKNATSRPATAGEPHGLLEGSCVGASALDGRPLPLEGVPFLQAAQLRQFCRVCARRRAGSVARGELRPRGFQSPLFRGPCRQCPPLRAALDGIFPAIDRPDMRRGSIEIRATDPELLLMRSEPLPQRFAWYQSLHAGIRPDAYAIGRQRAAIASTP